MNYARLGLAFLGGTVGYFAIGFILFAALPAMKTEFMKFPGVYRAEAAMMKLMPFDMLAILASVLVCAVLYAKMHPVGGNVVSGVYLGVLMGVFAVCVFVVHNYVLLNISLKLAVYQAVTYLVQWVVVGAAIGLIYKPL